MKSRGLPARNAALIALGLALTGCSAAERLKDIGEVPSMTKIQDPTAAPGYQPVAMPVPAPELA
jgi:flagellar L-ring protein FlgH